MIPRFFIAILLSVTCGMADTSAYSNPKVKRVNGEIVSVSGIPPGTVISDPYTGKRWKIDENGKAIPIDPISPAKHP